MDRQAKRDLNVHGDSCLRRAVEARTQPVTAFVHGGRLDCGSQWAHRVQRDDLRLVGVSENDGLIRRVR